jgi:adenosylcobinamide-GDP ribazoletransferase
MGFFIALRFLTVIPFLRRREIGPEELGRAIVYFPLVGVVIGLFLVFLNWLLGLALPPSLTRVLLVVSLAAVTGGLHLDGLADTFDGLAVRGSAEDRWQVMRDSRSGAFGIISVSCLLLVKYIALNSIPAGQLLPALVLMPVVSRWAMVYAIFAFPYARPSGLGKLFKQEVNRARFIAATVIALAAAVALAQLAGLFIMASGWLVAAATAAYFKSRFNGLTGDTYGALNEITEVAALILVYVFAGYSGLPFWR